MLVRLGGERGVTEFRVRLTQRWGLTSSDLLVVALGSAALVGGVEMGSIDEVEPVETVLPTGAGSVEGEGESVGESPVRSCRAISRPATP